MNKQQLIQYTKQDTKPGDCPSRHHSSGYLCTRPKGHEGPHIARGMRLDIIAAWNDPDGLLLYERR